MKKCCFTGHRPQSLPWGFKEKGLIFNKFKGKVKEYIKKSIEEGYCYFISGMAQGFDIICAEIVLDVKEKNNSIVLECAIPCKNQTKKWNIENVNRYNYIISKADIVTMVSNVEYYKGCMHKRNKYMIENSSKVIACFNGNSGGTKQTLTMAKNKGLEIDVIEP